MTSRLPDAYFDHLYADSADPWELATRWYEQRKYAITMALLPLPRYRHAFEPGCSVGALTARLAQRCDHVTAMDVAAAALSSADDRLRAEGCRDAVTLRQGSLDDRWPAETYDLVVISEVAYYLDAELLAAVLRRECPRLAPGATIVAAHWRHAVPEYPLTGDEANQIIADTPGLTKLGGYADADVIIDVLENGPGHSVADRTGVPGA